jgi:hypothetical protein
MSNDITNLSYRMTKQLDLAMNDLKNVKRNIKQMNSIIQKDNNSERKIENNYEEKIEENNYEEKIEENDIPAAGFVGTQHNMSHNRWMSGLRNRFSYY